MRSRPDTLFALSITLTLLAVSIRARPSTDLALAPQDAGAMDRNGPMRIALLVDTSDGVGSAMTQIRGAVAAFADALAPEHELMLVTIGRHTQVRVQPTTDRKKVKDSANGLTVDRGATALMDSMMEVDQRFLRDAGDRWSAMVVLTGNGNENSIRTDDKGLNDWLRSVSRRRISIDAIVLQFQPNGMPEVIARAATRAAGGRIESTTRAGALADMMKAIAERLGTEHPPRH